MSAESDHARIHRLSAAVGLLLAILGTAVVFVPSLGDAVPVTTLLTMPVAILAVMLGLWRVRVRRNHEVRHLDLPEPELPFALPTPGDDLDELLYRYTQRGEGTLEYPERIGKRLRDVAVAAIAHREECTREEAVASLDEGTWTENRSAAAFFSETTTVPSSTLKDRVFRALGRAENPYEQQVRETVSAIVSEAAMVDESSASEREASYDDGILSRLMRGSDARTVREHDRKSVQEYADDGDAVAGTVRYGESLETHRWLGIEAFSLVAAGVGVVAAEPGLLLAAAVGVTYGAYARSGTDPGLSGLTAERTVDTDSPAPGEKVRVTVELSNEGDTFLPALRIVDLVPANLRVVDGSPRTYTALRPGARVRMQYTVVAERGHHEWPLLAVGSGFSGSVEREAIVDTDTSIECVPRLRTVTDIAIRDQTTIFSGQVDTDQGGSGLEFHSVREHRPNDPMRRIEWKRHARTGELATIDFREERAATVLLLFDAREDAYVTDRPGNPHALDRSVNAASDVYAALADAGHLIGLAAFDTVPCYLGPSAGSGHDESARRLLAYHPALASLPPDMLDIEGGYIDPMNHIRSQLPTNTQVMLFSPLISDYPSTIARQLNAAGNRVTIISPDATATRTMGQRLARVERRIRINRLREYGVRVVDWDVEDSLRLTLDKARRRAGV